MIEKLKAEAYDIILKMEMLQLRLREINSQIMKIQTPVEPPKE